MAAGMAHTGRNDGAAIRTIRRVRRGIDAMRQVRHPARHQNDGSPDNGLMPVTWWPLAVTQWVVAVRFCGDNPVAPPCAALASLVVRLIAVCCRIPPTCCRRVPADNRLFPSAEPRPRWSWVTLRTDIQQHPLRFQRRFQPSRFPPFYRLHGYDPLPDWLNWYRHIGYTSSL